MDKHTLMVKQIEGEVSRLDLTIPGSYHIPKEKLDELSKTEQIRIGRLFYFFAAKIASCRLSSETAEDGGKIIWWEQAS